MARPLSEEKRNSILSAAAQVVAELGISAPTSRIAKEAGVAEGTIFTYFSNKDVLLNQLYLELKQEVAIELMTNFPLGKDLSEKVQHVWMSYVYWAVSNRDKRRAMQQLGVSNYISDETRHLTHEFLSEIDSMLQELSDHEKQVSPEFITAVMTSLSETTVDFMMQYPAKADEYAETGLRVFKSAIKLQ
jgi:AcrR family transcriptional regulator